MVMLMVTSKDEGSKENQRYLNIGCSTHMTGRRDWFVSFTHSKSRVKFVDHKTLEVEGFGNVLIKRNYGKKA